VQYLAGSAVVRGCSANPFIDISDDVYQGLNESLVGRRNNAFAIFICNNANLCNGSGRLAEISTMKILLPVSLVFLISFFSKL